MVCGRDNSQRATCVGNALVTYAPRRNQCKQAENGAVNHPTCGTEKKSSKQRQYYRSVSDDWLDGEEESSVSLFSGF
jgi:hypothetical protein